MTELETPLTNPGDSVRREGVKTLRKAGPKKVKMELASLEEVLAVSNQ